MTNPPLHLDQEATVTLRPHLLRLSGGSPVRLMYQVVGGYWAIWFVAGMILETVYLLGVK